ncbi:outer membrane protein [Marinomonas sp. TW1]|uniref:outer membrane protein n=1 Tax=Marinomonas sp. TW1 TaxID=1561203 RepID=UPI0007AFD74F|nr:outer membrane beta-barrel protein [Marinomonas sp. TW1]KZN15086.1 hypothetical protein OA79_02495 [Marinomonas sp. TW1]
MPANKVKKLILACGVICTSSALTAAPQYYGILELGSAQSKFGNLETAISETNATTEVVDDSDSAAYFSIGIGLDWVNQPLRSELVYSTFGDQSFINDAKFITYSGTERTTAKVKQESLMLNLLYDINIDSDKLKPFVGAGIGASKTKTSATQIQIGVNRSAAFSEASDTNFMWSLIVGANYNMTEKAQLGFGYRYTDAGNVSTEANCIGSDGDICDPGEKHSADLTSHLLFVNLSYYFE